VPAFRSVAHLEMFLSGCLHWMYALNGRGEVLAEHPDSCREVAQEVAAAPASIWEQALAPAKHGQFC
jgi:hypothetical protein